MKSSVVFPQFEIGNDPIVIRDFVQAVEGLGYEVWLQNPGRTDRPHPAV